MNYERPNYEDRPAARRPVVAVPATGPVNRNHLQYLLDCCSDQVGVSFDAWREAVEAMRQARARYVGMRSELIREVDKYLRTAKGAFQK